MNGAGGHLKAIAMFNEVVRSKGMKYLEVTSGIFAVFVALEENDDLLRREQLGELRVGTIDS